MFRRFAHPALWHDHPGTPGGSGSGGPLRPRQPGRDAPNAPDNLETPPPFTGNRLNLLLSWGGWRPDSWADHMAALLEPMGVQSLKASTVRQAEDVIRHREVHIAVVDLGLPIDARCPEQEGGARILDLLRRLENPPPTVIVNSPRSARDAVRDMSAALRFDAFAVVDRTGADVEVMLKVLQRALDRFYRGRWPGPAPLA